MNEIFKFAIDWLKSSPRWCKIVAPLLACALAAVYLLSSCGVTRAVIRAPANNSYNSVSITTNNPTSVHLSNSVDSTRFNINPKKSK